MSDKTKIEWTDATWNPIRARDLGPVGTGMGAGFHCEILTPGCEHCYAQSINKRLGTHRPYLRRERGSVSIYVDEKTLAQPLHWRRPRKIFPCSMTDLFGEWVTDDVLDRVFAVMALAPQHRFLILTKRAERMRDYIISDRRGKIYDAAETISQQSYGHHSIGTGEWPLPNCWLGVSVEDQRRADERIPELLATPAAVRWISAEPMLGSVDLQNLVIPRAYGSGLLDAFTLDFKDHHQQVLAGPPSGHGPLDWVVCGGESGTGARSCSVEWVGSIVSQCKAAGVAVFVKQMGSQPVGKIFRSGAAVHHLRLKDRKGGDPAEWPEELRVREFPRIEEREP